MSKQDIENVTQLAAHLANHAAHFGHAHDFVTQGRIERRGYAGWMGGRCGADAMKLQRLGRSASTNAIHWCNGTKDEAKCISTNVRYLAQATEILKPYGLKAKVGGDPRGYCLHIIGLPGNTLGGDTDGYGI